MSESRLIADIEQVSKKYCRQLQRSLRYGLSDLVREAMGMSASPQLRPGEFFAVKDASFQIRSGESVALLGPNGAGKSTMVKLINGLLKPTTGAIRLKGRVTALTTLGAGFNPVLSGRENIYINAAVLGFSRREVERRYREMMDFAEIEDAIDDPVKTYSSGMRARLGYSIAAFLKPDLLLLDEVLATGDRRFKLRCFEHLESLVKQGTSVMLVSHNVGRLTRICQRAIVFDRGKVCFDGGSREGLETYYDVLKIRQLQGAESTGKAAVAVIDGVELLDDTQRPCEVFDGGDPIRLRIHLSSEASYDDLRLVVHLESPSNLLTTMATKPGHLSVPAGESFVDLCLPETSQFRGNFFFVVRLTGSNTSLVLSETRQPFRVSSAVKSGVMRIAHTWQTSSELADH